VTWLEPATMSKALKVHEVDREIAGLEPFAKELVRLARDVTLEIDRGRLTPRCLSGLTAMKPLIGLIQGAALKALRTSAGIGSSDDNDDRDDEDAVEATSDDDSTAEGKGSGSTPGYL
jgi:hypothetical protein